MSAAGTATFRSILEKPLKQLTEDDISQLTREDCRKYLKEKGMRRPSWNKSQAIQQVISLKALLEPGEDSGAGALRKIVSSPLPITPRPTSFRVKSNSADSAKEASADVQVSAEESGPCPRKEVSKPAPEPVERPVEADDRGNSPRSQCPTEASVGQMTIFYSGKVNVYDGVTPDKARAIMHLAASPVPASRENSFGGTTGHMSSPWQLPAANDKSGFLPPSSKISQLPRTDKMVEYTQQCWEKENDADGQPSREVSLQRYREKRKDRLKPKKNVGIAPSSLEVYLNQQVKTHISNGNSSRSSTSSPTQPGPPQAPCSVVDNQPKIACLPVDLNEKYNMEC
ncbi:hypothetical protein UlMin_009732 [Ulmus minor]